MSTCCCTGPAPGQTLCPCQLRAAPWDTRIPLTILPPLVTEEDVAKALMSVAFMQCQPNRGDVFGWLDDNIAPFAKAVVALYAPLTKRSS